MKRLGRKKRISRRARESCRLLSMIIPDSVD